MLGRWARSPKALVVMLLLLLIALALWRAGPSKTIPQLTLAAAIAVAIDIAIGLWRRGLTRFPTGGLVTGLMIGMILAPAASLLAVSVAAAGALASKHLLRVPRFHLFNPAAAGLLGSLLLVPAAQSWWGSLADLPAPFVLILLAGGAVVVWRVNRVPSTLAFFGLYFMAFTAAAMWPGQPSPLLAAVFRPPFLNAAVFFGFLMLTDPSTSPSRTPEQLTFGAITAIASAITFMVIHGLHYLFIGLLLANAWYAWHRTTRSAHFAGDNRPGTGTGQLSVERPL